MSDILSMDGWFRERYREALNRYIKEQQRASGAKNVPEDNEVGSDDDDFT